MSEPPKAEISEQTAWMLAVRDRGDRATFGRLHDHCAPRLKGFAMRIGLAAAQIEGVVQHMMLTVWHKARLLHSLPGRGSARICLAVSKAPLPFNALIPRLLPPLFRI